MSEVPKSSAEEAAEPDDRLVDPAALDRLRSWGGDVLLGRMITLFEELAPERVEALEDGLAAGDLERVERAAHSLKSSAGNLGADELRRQAGRVEEAAAKGDSARMDGLVGELLKCCRETTAALRRLHPGEPEPSGEGES